MNLPHDTAVPDLIDQKTHEHTQHQEPSSGSGLQAFAFENHLVRALFGVNTEPWFVATDVARVLGYRNAPDMVRMLDEDEADTHNMRIRSADGVVQTREITVISESGLYACILKSRRPEAKTFKRWVTHEVLPAIRKTGSYAMPKAQAVASEQLPHEDWMSFATGRPMPMLDAVVSILAVGQAVGKTGIQRKAAMDASIQTIEQQVGLHMEPLRSALKHSASHASHQRYRNEQFRLSRRLRLSDLATPSSRVFTTSGTPVSAQTVHAWEQWAQLPLHQRCIRVLWANNIRSQAVVLWYMMEHHRLVAGLGPDFSIQVAASDVLDVCARHLGLNRSSINSALAGLIENKTLLVKPHVPCVTRSMWLDPHLGISAMQAAPYPSEELMLLNAVLGSRSQAVVVHHLMCQQSSNAQGVSPDNMSPIQISCAALAAQVCSQLPGINERGLRRAIHTLEQLGFVKNITANYKTHAKSLMLDTDEVQRAISYFLNVFGDVTNTPTVDVIDANTPTTKAPHGAHH